MGTESSTQDWMIEAGKDIAQKFRESGDLHDCAVCREEDPEIIAAIIASHVPAGASSQEAAKLDAEFLRHMQDEAQWGIDNAHRGKPSGTCNAIRALGIVITAIRQFRGEKVEHVIGWAGVPTAPTAISSGMVRYESMMGITHKIPDAAPSSEREAAKDEGSD